MLVVIILLCCLYMYTSLRVNWIFVVKFELFCTLFILYLLAQWLNTLTGGEAVGQITYM